MCRCVPNGRTTDSLISFRPHTHPKTHIHTQCVLLGVGEGLSIIPAVDLMRMALPESLVGPCGGGDDEHVTASLAAIMSAATSLGEFLGPLVGGVLMQHLPSLEEVGCIPAKDPDGDCGSPFRWAATTVALALFAAVGVCWLKLSTNEAAVMTPRIGSFVGAGARALVVGEDEEGEYRRLPAVEEGEEDSVGEEKATKAAGAAGAAAAATTTTTPTRPARKPRSGSLSSTGSPSPERPRSRPPTPISFASIR